MLNAMLDTGYAGTDIMSGPSDLPRLVVPSATSGSAAASSRLNSPSGAQPAPSETRLEPIAIIGIACRLPGEATNPQELWRNLAAGRSAWSRQPNGRYNLAAYQDRENPVGSTTNTGGGHFLTEDIAAFDAAFFGINALEAKAMDPQQRLSLEIAYEAFENAGITANAVWGSNTGVYMGQWTSDYAENLSRDPEYPATYHTTGAGPAITSNRISYHFNLTGPSMTVDTGCSASLVALHLAVQSLRNNETSMALVGGVNILADPQRFLYQSKLKMFSNDGKSFCFDDRANGYGRGEGCAAIVLKPLSAALRHGDTIRGVLRNSVINQDGRTNGITVPSGEAQERAIRKAYADAGLAPWADYVEAHGTGTAVGDPIEVHAIASVLGQRTAGSSRLPIGSIKGNIGHTESCAGLSGLIKAVLMLEKQAIPPQVNFQTPNKRLLLDDWGLYVPVALEHRQLNRISVNSFGYGGTNAHVIIESASQHLPTAPSPVMQASPVECPIAPRVRNRAFLISGATEESCQTLARKLSSWVSEAAQTSDDGAFLERLAHTLMHRTLHKRRIAIIASSSKELASQLQDAGNKPVPASSLSTSHRLGFIFGGQGAQYFDMARGLSSTWPAFADSLKRAERQLMVLGADWNLTKELDRSSQESRVDQPAIGQAASTAVQLGLIDAFEALGIRPDMVAGHSSGEISAAYCAGLLSFEDAMTVAYHRGRLTSAMLSEAVSDRAPGAMLAVGASAAVVESHLSDPTLQAAGQLTIACYNSPASVTVSGDEAAIHCLAQRLEAASVFNRVLRTGGAAYHSHHMHAIKESYMAALQGLPWRGRESSSSSTIMISSVTGQILNLHEINGEYWARNLVAPVRFETCLRKMCDTNNDVSVIVELGPHATLEGPVKQTLQALNASARVHYVPTLRRKTDADGALLNAVAKLYCHNVKGVDLQRVNCGFHDDTPARLIDVPPYAFDHGQTFWHESRLSRAFRHPSFPPHELLGNLAVDNNEYEPHWRRFLGVNDVKWLQGHVIQGQVVFPAAAYLAVAAEALDRHRNRQVRSDGEAVRSGGFDFRNVSFGKALVLRDDLPLDHELCVSLRPEVRSSRQSSESWMDFRVYSVSLERGWAEHCRGSISRLSQSLASDETHEQSAVDHSAQTTYLRKVESSHFYKKCRDVGLEWATPFDNLTTLLLDDSTCDYTVATPNILSTADTNAERTTYCMHPALLDAALFHGMCALVFLNDARPSAMVPTFIQRLVIDDRARHYKSDLMCRAVRDNALTSEVTVTPMSSAGEAATPILRAYGVSLTKLPSDFAATDASHQICHVPRWFPYHSIATTADLQSLADSATSQLTTLPRSMLQQNITLNDQTRMYVRAALDKVSSECVVDDYRKLYLSWMTELVGGSEDNSSAESSEDGNKKEALGAVGQAIKAIGTNLPGILQGRVEPLAVLAADNVLSTIYSDERCQRCYAQIGAFCTSLAQRVPRLKMLEVGAGTGALSEPILQTLSRASDTAIGRYDFTDISAGFMDAARARLSEFADVVQYHVLDAERAPAAQGFEEGSYDVVFAANVVHATASIKQTLQNIHRLLKPDGVLILMELTRDEPFYNLIFGALPGWWAGAGEGRIRSPLLHGDKWRSELNGAGFDAPMVHLHDYEEAEGGTISVIISRATGPIASTMTDKEQVELAYCFSGDHQLLQLQKTLSSELPNFGCSTVDVYTDSQPHILVVPPSICENLLLGSMSPMAWSCFRKKVLSSRAVLLVTKGVYMEKANPFGAAMLGFANTIRREQPETRIITLDLSNAADSKGSAAAIAKVLQSPSFALQNDASAYENHYAELDGQLFVLRMMSEPKMDQHIRNATGTSEPTLGPFSETTRSLTAEIAIPGVLDSLRWVDDVHAQEPLHPDEIELDLRAASINFKDVLIAAGQLEGTTEMRNDCSGVVTRVGENMKHRFKLNDRVCCYYSRSYANKPRVHGDCAAVLPDDLDFDQAASLPIVWGTAYYALVTKAKLAKGETVLIHSAAGAVGQAAIAIAHYLGAEVFATVGSATKREFLTSRYGIKDDHIFSSRDTSFGQGIRQMTSKKGVNVVLNSLSGELFRESCTCLGYGGRFVEIGRKDYLEDMLIPSRFFLANITFAYVDLALMIEVERPVVRELLRSVVDLASSGAVALTSITKMPISEIVSAFRTIQAAKHMGKIILSVEPQQQVKLIAEAPSHAQLRADGVYLIVGGLGGVGQSLVRWMAARGARHIVTLSRSNNPSASAQALMEEMQASGVDLLHMKCDISSLEEIKATLKEIDGQCGFGRVLGVINSAMVIQDALYENMTIDQWSNTLRPKVDGSWNLHAALPADLDFFVMLSSAVAIRGNPGQCHYGAACAFQDALAHHRSASGLPAHSINIAAVSEIGFVSENPEVAAALRRNGLGNVTQGELLSHLDYVVSHASDRSCCQSSIGLFPPDDKLDPRLSATLATCYMDSKFRHLAPQDAAATAGQTLARPEADALNSIASATTMEEAIGHVEEAILQQLSKLIMTPRERLVSSASLDEYGVDSLVAVELKNWLSACLRANVPMLSIRSSSSIHALAGTVASQSRLVAV